MSLFSELFTIEAVKKNIPLCLCLVWLWTQSTRIEKLEDQLNNCYLIRTSEAKKAALFKAELVAILPEELKIKLT